MKFPALLLPAAWLFCAPSLSADVVEDFDRAERLGGQLRDLATGDRLQFHWSQDDRHLVFRVNGAGDSHTFMHLDPATGKKADAFDHAALAEALADATGAEVDEKKLPLDPVEMTADGKALRFHALGRSWKFEPRGNKLSPDDLPPRAAHLESPDERPRGRPAQGPPTTLDFENATGDEIAIFWLSPGGERVPYGRIAPGATTRQNTHTGHRWLATRADGEALARVEATAEPSLAKITGKVSAPPRPPEGISPDGKWRAYLRDHNVFVEPTGGGEPVRLSKDGSRSDRYEGPLHWSPDSRKLVAFRAKSVDQRRIHIVETSPADQLQPKLRTHDYTKPGDPIRQPKPRLFDLGTEREIPIEQDLFANPWSINHTAWARDSSEFTFVYNQRGHQIMRVLGVRAENGGVRVILEEKSDTFIDYSQKFFIHRLPHTREFLWASERSGFNHVYLVDEATGRVKNAVTKGNWNVREVVKVDEESRTLVLRVLGVTGQDPYHAHFIRVNFDGSGFTRLSTADGHHRASFSPGGTFITTTWSRVDHPPVTELRRADDGTLVAEISRADDSALREKGWSPPERFTAKGRDGETDIHGIIIKPTRFDPAKRYPVVEDIYAGPHDHFVPKSWSAWTGMNTMAELGFIVVKIDGMGTNWRGKAFQDVAWKNLMDSGFPDRIAWLKSAAETRPWMDLGRVGIHGGSAGGQSALAALLNHGDFYKAGVADCGCHDNRMDKIWWNEAWMGWPVDESYERNSNVTHAAKLRGKLLLIVGELDSNVDPASTYQVVHALQQAGKDFEVMPIINAGHGAAETPFGRRLRARFLTRHLLD